MTRQELGRRNQLAGDRFERKAHRTLAVGSLASMRSAGSRKLFDCMRLQPDKLRLIMCRASGYLSIKERKALERFFLYKPKWVQVEMWFRRTPKTQTKFIIKTVDHIRPYYR